MLNVRHKYASPSKYSLDSATVKAGASSSRNTRVKVDVIDNSVVTASMEILCGNYCSNFKNNQYEQHELRVHDYATKLIIRP